MEEETFESCTGCWYAEHGECSLGYEPCHAGKRCGNCYTYDKDEEYCPYFQTTRKPEDDACSKWEWEG